MNGDGTRGRRLAKRLGSVALVVLAATAARADDAAARFDRASASYEAGDYRAASESLSSIVRSGTHDETVYYNLGCALAREGRLGPSTLAFLRALHLDPGDDDAQANLEWVRSRLPDRNEDPSLPAVVIGRWAALLAMPGGAVVALILWWTAAVLSGVSLLGTEKGRRSVALRRGAIAIAILAGLVATPLVIKWMTRGFDDRAVILSSRVEARSGPSETNQTLFTLYEGFVVTAIETRRGWVRVGASGGLSGWVEGDALASVRPEGPGRWIDDDRGSALAAP